jgi:hypothetical protein
MCIMQPKHFPIGSWVCDDWSLPVDEMVNTWVELGFTLTLSPRFDDTPEDHQRVRRMLDLAQQRGIQLILCDSRTRAPRSDWSEFARPIDLPADHRARAAAAVADYADHPAVWGFYVEDEPLAGGLGAVAEACRIIRDLTDQAEPYINLLPDHVMSPDGPKWRIEEQVGFKDFDRYLDHVVKTTGNGMLSYDCYSQMSPVWGGIDQYFRNLAKYQAAALRNDVEFWLITLAAGHWMYRAPSPTEMGWQFYTALAYGVSGIHYFYYRARGNCLNSATLPPSYGAPIDELGQHGPLYQQLRRQHHQFCTQWENVYRRCRVKRTTHWPEAPNGATSFDGTGVVINIKERAHVAWYGSTSPSLVVGEFEDENSVPHVILANNGTTDSVAFEATFKGSKVCMVNGISNLSEVGSDTSCGVVVEGFIQPGQAYFVRVER